MKKLLLGGACLALLAACGDDAGGAPSDDDRADAEVQQTEDGAQADGDDGGEDADEAEGADDLAAEDGEAPEPQAEADEPRFGEFGFDTAGMNRDADPGDDFYLYANGQWDEDTDIPSDRARYGVFDMLSLEAEANVQDIIADAVEAGGDAGSNNQMIGDLYQSWMDADAINARGLEPAQPWLDEIAAIEDHEDAAALMGTIHHHSAYGLWISPDPADPTVYTVRAYQGGLGMPDREYYLDDSERFAEYREAYRDYIVRVHDLAGIEDGEAKADAIIALETAIAEEHWTRERSRQVSETYNEMTVEEFDELAPAFNFAEAMDNLGLGAAEEVIVSQPSAIEATGEIFAETDIATIRDYMAFHFISDRASWLGDDFDRANFDFYSATLSGTEEQRDRDKRGAQLVGGQLGHVLGQEYVDRHFPPESKEQMDALVDNLTTAFEGRLENLDWMDDETRQEALTKLSTFEPRIGYPEIWDSFEGVQITADDYFANRIALTEHRWAEELDRFDEEVDRRRWSWPPQIVNASYNPLMNQITFPAGILQAPFFDPNADPAMNYGGIGAVIGHEIGHGFDDQGRRYDAEGTIRDWWTEETNERFEEASGRLAEQYDEFCPFEGECVNGRLAMGENIGDLGGMQMAYSAYRDYVEANYEDGEAPVIDGFTGDQRFFLAWAQVWRSLYRDDALRSQLVNGPHSPGMYRVNGVVRNHDAWYEAFDIGEDHELYLPPEERVSIW